MIKEEPKEINLAAEDIPIDILYEDDDIIVVNKPKGMVVHPANGNPDRNIGKCNYACMQGLPFRNWRRD